MSPPRVYPRGIRQQGIPSGYVLGRTDSGRGAAHLIPISALAGLATSISGKSVGGGGSSGGGNNETSIELLTAFLGGPFTANQQFVCSPAPRAASFPDISDLSVATSLIAPTGNCNIMLCFNAPMFLSLGGTNGVFCQIAWTAGSTTAVVTFPNGGLISEGEVLTFVCPNDTALSFVSILLFGALVGI